MFHFPKWKYHRIEKPVIVNDAEAEADLGESWYDSPTEIDPGEELEAKVEPDIAAVDAALPLPVLKPFSYDGNDLEPGQEVAIRGNARRAELFNEGFIGLPVAPLAEVDDEQ